MRATRNQGKASPPRSLNDQGPGWGAVLYVITSVTPVSQGLVCSHQTFTGRLNTVYHIWLPLYHQQMLQRVSGQSEGVQRDGPEGFWVIYSLIQQSDGAEQPDSGRTRRTAFHERAKRATAATPRTTRHPASNQHSQNAQSASNQQSQSLANV